MAAFMPLPDLLPIPPFTRPVRGDVTLPGSKSLTNRALLLAALCDRPVLLTGALFSDDTELMATALRKLGFTVEADAAMKTARVLNQQNGFTPAGADLFVGLAGTAARFLTALCAAAPRGVYRLDGVPQMRKRPMKGLIDALRSIGADIRCTGEEGFFPLEIHARGLRGGAVEIDARESSQMLSALLMVAPLAREPVEIRLVGSVRWPFVQMTARLMEHFGQRPLARLGDDRFRVSPGSEYALAAGTYAIEPDATAASYFLTLPMVTEGSILLPGLRSPGEGLQGDTQFAHVLQRAGARVEMTKGGTRVTFTPDLVRAGVTENFAEFSDTFLTLAAISPLLSGITRINGIAHTRKQETDRVAGMARELTRLGQHVIETEDALEIHPRPLKSDVEIETYHDHRFAMSFGILGCYDLHQNGQPWLSIKNPACCAKTFPDFFDLLAAVRTRSVAG
jgi:3-phosphoshikimate 1-carboxyvinyltransferase